MANHKSAIKRHRQSLKRRDRNRAVKLDIKGSIKKVRTAVEKGDLTEAKKLLVVAERALARAAGKGVIHKANASRRISRVASLVAKKAK